MLKALLSGSALACAVIATPAQATVITFDSGVTGPSYTESGVTFTPFGGGSFTTGYGGTPNGTYGLIVDNFNPIQAVISGGTSMVSVDIGDYNEDADDLFLRAYDSFNVFLGESTFSIPGSFVGMQTLSVSFAGISRVEFGGVGVSGSSVYSDNFTFEANGAVPEPATWAMMLIGFGALGAAMRRKRRETLTVRYA